MQCSNVVPGNCILDFLGGAGLIFSHLEPRENFWFYYSLTRHKKRAGVGKLAFAICQWQTANGKVFSDQF